MERQKKRRGNKPMELERFGGGCVESGDWIPGLLGGFVAKGVCVDDSGILRKVERRIRVFPRVAGIIAVECLGGYPRKLKERARAAQTTKCNAVYG